MVWLALLVLWPLAELFVMVEVAEAIGVLWMLALLLLSCLLGMRILRSQGRAAWRRFLGAIKAGRIPAEEALDGALAVAGGLLLIVPGFIGDAVGALLVLPATRTFASRVLIRRHRAGANGQGTSASSRRASSWHSGSRNARAAGYDADASAVDIDEPELDR